MNDVTGGCLCGAVKFTASGMSADYHVCHCSKCRRWSSGPMFAAGAAEVRFEGRENLKLYDSSEWAARGFCASCGSHVCFYYKPADRYILSIGACDDETRFRLAGEIFVDEKPESYAFAGDHPRKTGEEFLAEVGAA